MPPLPLPTESPPSMMFLIKLAVRRLRRVAKAMPGWVARWRAAKLGCTVHPTTVIELEEAGRLVLGRHVTIGEFNVIVARDESPAASVRNCQVRIGDRTYIGAQNNIRAAGGDILIGRDCLISQQVTIVASNHGIQRGLPMNGQPWDTEKIGVSIGDDVWVGANAVILPGIKVGAGAVIAAGSVVTKDVAEYTIVGGVPARLLGQRT